MASLRKQEAGGGGEGSVCVYVCGFVSDGWSKDILQLFFEIEVNSG